jgi:hypothetical protein
MTTPFRFTVGPNEQVQVALVNALPGESMLVEFVVFASRECGRELDVIPYMPNGCKAYLGDRADTATQKNTGNPIIFDQPGTYQLSPHGVVSPDTYPVETQRWSTV